MKTEWLEDFIAVTTEGSFSRAAALRHVAQPAFSRRIKLLEDWVDEILIDRSAQPVQMTEAGREFLPVAKSVVNQLYSGREKIHQAAKGARTLKFASTHTLNILFFPEWFQSITGRSSEASLSLESDHLDSCTRSLTQGECHFMLCFTHHDTDLGFDQNMYESKVIGFDTLIPISAPDKNGNPTYCIPGSKDRPTKYLYFSQALGLGQVVDSMLERHHHRPYVIKSSSSPIAAALTSMAENGLGVAWIPEILAKSHIQDGSLMVSGDDSWHIPLEIRIFRSRSHLPKQAQNFWGLIP